jgi:RNA recognition motif-containing protein
MSKKLYVGNLPYNTTNDELVEVFSQYGQVSSAQVMMDRDTNRSRGFAFVEMADGADQAIAGLNGAEFQGRTLTVNEARPREERPRNSGGGGRPRSGGYGGGGYGGGGYGGGGRRY